jgi:hypothetical protein
LQPVELIAYQSDRRFLWNNMRVRAIIAGLLMMGLGLGAFSSGQEDEHTPELLLTAKLLRRLKRDRTRQTVRWLNFEKRVQSTADSPERGFELALYYAVTGDADRGKEAVRWALDHKAASRQVALVLDWARAAMSVEQIRELSQNHAQPGNDASDLRDALFMAIEQDTLGQMPLAKSNQQILQVLHKGSMSQPRDLYAAIEYVMALRAAKRVDLRETDPVFFRELPKAFLLSLPPDKVEHPDWMAHAAAIAMVSLDPNLESSQFLQGWSMEDRQMIREGEGVAYELLWADPYLPGIAYQNMDPWTYDPSGSLFARANWNPDSCWVAVTSKGLDKRNCSASELQNPKFGSLNLMELPAKCVDVPGRKSNEVSILWKLRPGADVFYERDGKRLAAAADPAGLWLIPNDVDGKACLGSRGH